MLLASSLAWSSDSGSWEAIYMQHGETLLTDLFLDNKTLNLSGIREGDEISCTSSLHSSFLSLPLIVITIWWTEKLFEVSFSGEVFFR